LEEKTFSGVHVSDDEGRLEVQGRSVARTAVRADDVVVIPKNGTGFFDVGQVAVGEDNDSLQKKNPPRAEDG
jgi:hypothetical protein